MQTWLCVDFLPTLGGTALSQWQVGDWTTAPHLLVGEI